ncbi:M16 family metallopeptidase [Reichenbachiella versicolor]|uniref:M16 family metallopeptidase n=1 Tax=Reichenbachiella versicolor TaxID=1821036 RepID=UPI000D6E7DB3|nr:M16 family metallopeptidase [Reichenbachiella versicolor]
MRRTLYILLIVTISVACTQSKTDELISSSDGKYTYEYVEDDPMKTRIYTLENGLKVYLSAYANAPRAQVLIPVRAGGKNDPADNTGLAHYLEHMMFKGTGDFGTLDYEKEKILLDSIEMMFEHYGTLTDKEERKAYYAKIDEISNRAAELAIPNEYDQMTALLGAKRVNAWTSFDETVYTVDIPSNELKRYLKVEGNRFKTIVGRLFHTELETVYEEKNRKSDGFDAFQGVLENLFPTHQYGTQSVIGTAEHLKNPSITAIKKYFYNYYRPNNAAICISGDIDYDKTIRLIDQYFGDWKPNENLTEWVPAKEEPITTPQFKEVWGPESEFVYIGYRFDGRKTKDYILLSLVDMILSNSQAGLIDINLKQQQQVLSAGSFPYFLTDYSTQFLYGYPKEGQTLDEVKELLLGQLELIKKGEFEEWLLDAIITDFKISKMKGLESNKTRASNLKEAFIFDIKWSDYLKEIEKMESITKEEIVAFANEHFKDNYAYVYKRTGEDPNKQIVEKPKITKVPVNRGVQSDFNKEITEMTPEKLLPVFLDYDKEITKNDIESVKVLSKKNEENELFELSFLYEFGKNDHKTVGIAAQYSEYIGNGSLSAEEFKKEMYKLGCSFSIKVDDTRTSIRIKGLDEKMQPAIELVESMFATPSVNQEALDKLVERNLKSRVDAKKDRERVLWDGLANYGKYGAKNPFTNKLSNEQLKALKAEDLVSVIQNFTKWKHRILYYGPKSPKEIVEFIKKNHSITDTELQLPAKNNFELADADNKIFWTHFDMKQSEIVFFNKNIDFNPKLSSKVRLYNQYFGSGMNSIVFQEIREAQGLAYSVTSRYVEAKKADDSNYLFAYVGTQADKQAEAMSSMTDLLNNMPESEGAFDIAKKSILNKIESERITKNGILWNYVRAQDKGLNYDIRKDIYQDVQELTLMDIKDFQSQNVKDKPYNIVLIGDREQIDIDNLSKYGEVNEVSLEEIFGY